MWRRRKDRERELERELRADLELEAEELQDRGLSGEQARYAARRALGNMTLVQEEVRRMWGSTTWQILMQDFRYAARNLRKSPGFAATAFLTLALGIGASAAVFTVVDSVLLMPLAYPDSGRLVAVWERVRFLGGEPGGPNPKHVDIWQQRTSAFRGLVYQRQMAMGLSAGNEHPRLAGAVVSSANLFDVLQVQAALGRTFVPEDGTPGHDGVAVLTYGLWQSLFHGDPAVIGKTVRLDNVPRQVVGVLPEGFQFPSSSVLRSFRRGGGAVSAGTEPVLFFPAAFDMSQFAWDGNYGNFVCLGRLNPGVSATQAEAQLNAATAQLLREMPQAHDRSPGALTALVQPMQEAITGNSKTGLWLLMAAVMGLMLLACLNLANAQLGRTLARSREAAVRTALGAAHWRLIWSSLSENLLLAASGGAAGMLLAYGGLELFRRSSPVNVPRLAEVHLNVGVLLFAMAVTFSASIVSGILPALRLLAADPQGSLQLGTRAAGSRQGNAVRRWLVGLQVCGCTVLLLVTGLFSKSLLHLLREDKGFETGQVTVAEVRLNPQAYPKDSNRAAFDDGVLQNLRAIPGVRTAALVSAMPLDGESWIEAVQRVDRPHMETPLINFRWASPGYFEATRQRLVAGRFLEERDVAGHGAVLTDGEAKALWGNESAIGGQVRIEGRVFTVVGVVADSHSTSLKTPATRMAFVHYKDRVPFGTFFLVRAATPLAAAMREAIWKYDQDATVGRVKTLDAQMADSVAVERFQTEVLAVFGSAALLLSMLGIYGVLSYSVTTRRQEIGVRMALGARRSGVYALTFSEAAAPVLCGIVAGLAASIAAGRLVRGMLYGVQPVDAAVMLAVVVVFLASAAAAAYLPARRAASVDPMEALRSE